MTTFEELAELLLTPSAQVAVIIALAEIAKQLKLPTRYIPLLDLALGLLLGILVEGLLLSYGVALGAILGVGLGLSACGLFSGAKNLFERRD